MRKLVKFMLLLIPMVLMIACSSDDDSSSNNNYSELIVGKWTSIEDPGEEIITFTNDGKFSATNVEYNYTVNGTYKLNGSKVKIEINSEVSDTEIMKLDQNKLEWKVKDEDGDYTEAYIRVP